MPEIVKQIFGPSQNPLCHSKNVRYSEVRFNLISEAVFQPQLIHHFGYSKITTYSEANLCSEKFTLDVVVIFGCGTSYMAWQTFHAVCITTLQPLDSSANGGRRPFTQVHEMYNFWLKVFPLIFILHMCIKQYMYKLHRSHIHVLVTV